jgi:hypothetical protein
MTAQQAEDGLALLNQLLDSLSLEQLLVYYTPPVTTLWPAGQQVRTWGPGGDIPGARPLKLQPYAQYRDEATGLDLPLVVYDRQRDYVALTLKAQASSTPQALYYAPTVPLGQLFAWPVPSMEWIIIVFPWQPLGGFVSLDAEILFPPGYERVLRSGLALEASPPYGVQPSPLTAAIYAEAKANLKRMNQVVPILGIDPSLTGPGGRDPYEIYTGTPWG